MSGTKSVTLAAVSVPCYAPEMAQNLASGEVAEWFKAAVLKTAPENIGIPQKPARLAVFRARRPRVRHPFPKNIQAHIMAQEA